MDTLIVFFNMPPCCSLATPKMFCNGIFYLQFVAYSMGLFHNIGKMDYVVLVRISDVILS
jgi:hypothetical protein